MVLLQLKKGGVVKVKGEGEKEKECTTECKSRSHCGGALHKAFGDFGDLLVTLAFW